MKEGNQNWFSTFILPNFVCLDGFRKSDSYASNNKKTKKKRVIINRGNHITLTIFFASIAWKWNKIIIEMNENKKGMNRKYTRQWIIIIINYNCTPCTVYCVQFTQGKRWAVAHTAWHKGFRFDILFFFTFSYFRIISFVFFALFSQFYIIWMDMLKYGKCIIMPMLNICLGFRLWRSILFVPDTLPPSIVVIFSYNIFVFFLALSTEFSIFILYFILLIGIYYILHNHPKIPTQCKTPWARWWKNFTNNGEWREK